MNVVRKRENDDVFFQLSVGMCEGTKVEERQTISKETGETIIHVTLETPGEEDL